MTTIQKMKTLTITILFYTLLHVSAFAADVNVAITNLTNGIYFTPLLISAHENGMHLFELGTKASSALQAMAEGGDLSGLLPELGGVDEDTIENPAEGMLAPGGMTSAHLVTQEGNTRLSIVAMLLPTNDGFVGVDALEIPTRPGIYTYYLNAYDAGTEVNDELITGGSAPFAKGIPADPGEHAGEGGSGVTDDEANMTVHIHRGIIGDQDKNGGISDLDSTVHRWLNPVAKLTLTVTDESGGAAMVTDDLETFHMPMVQYKRSFYAITLKRVDGLEFQITKAEMLH